MKNPDISPISIYITILKLSKLPEEIIKEIYKYLHETLIMENNKEYIKNKIEKAKKSIHVTLQEMPYPKNITITNLTALIETELKLRKSILKYCKINSNENDVIYKKNTNNVVKQLRYI